MENSLVKVKKDANTFMVLGNQLIERSESLSIKTVEDTQIATAILKDCQKTEKELEEKRVEITKPLNDFIGEVNSLFKATATPTLEAKNSVKQKILVYNTEQERIKREEEAKRFAEEQARLRKLEEERLERERIETAKRLEEEKKLKAEQDRLRKLDEERIEKELKASMANEDAQKKIREEAERQRIERELLEKEKLEIERQKREATEEIKRLEEERKLKAEAWIAEQKAAIVNKDSKIKGIVKKWSWEVVEEDKIPRSFCSPDSKKINESIKAGVREIEGIRIFEATDVR